MSTYYMEDVMTASRIATPPPMLPRDAWSAHPNFPAHVLLMGSHANFRRYSLALIEALRRGALEVDVVELGYTRWISAMRSHEAYEERKLYPYLGRRFGWSFDEAREGHEALHAAHDAVRSAFAALRAGAVADAPGRDALIAALQVHHDVLDAHLDLEEDHVIPLLLALSREEFETYLESSIATLMRQLDEAGYR